MAFISNYYYVSLILQAVCVFHCLKKRNENRWIWIIVFLPVVGCVVYFFSEIITRGNVQSFNGNINTIFNSGPSIRRLQEQLRFADTFENKVLLADAYFDKGAIEEATHLYEGSLSGVFDENEYVLMKLILAYAKQERYSDIIPLAKKVYRSPQFSKSTSHLAYAKALEFTGQPDLAEKEFLAMQGRFAHFELRYHYGLFLVRMNRPAEAKALFEAIINEEAHLSGRERRLYRTWFQKTKEEVSKMA